MFDIRSLIAGWRNRPAGPFERAVVALESGDVAGALHGFTRALADAGDDRERLRALNKRGVAHVRGGDRPAALSDFTAALEIDPRYAPAVTNVGNLLFEEGVLDDAIAHFEAAIRYDEKYATAHLNLAVALRQTGRRGEAVRHLRIAQRVESRQLFRRALKPGNQAAE